MRKSLIAGVLVAFLAGCGGGAPQAEVAGTVTLDDKPVGPGWIEFASRELKTAASGTINADGSYTLSVNPKSGLPAGKYQVALSVREVPANVNPGDRPPPGKSLIPEKYEGTESGLEFDVTAGTNVIDVKLTGN